MKYKKYLTMVMAGTMVTGMMPVTAMAEDVNVPAVVAEEGDETAAITGIAVKTRKSLKLQITMKNDGKL